jgi:hypothetical protein
VGLSNQGLLQESIRGVTSTTYPMNGDWLALFALSNITTGTWDERCLQWINLELTASYTNLADAQHAYALAQGFDRWSDMSGLAPNVEQDTGNQTTTAATSDTATFTNATVTGRGVIVVFALKSGRRVSTLVDNKGNTYNRVGFAVDNSDAVVEMWYAQQITGGASHVITATYDGSANCVWGAIEVSRVKGGGGLLDANSVRTTTRGGSGSSASVTVTSGTLRDRNELVVAMLSLAGGGANAGIDTPTAYTAITQFNDFDGIHAGHGAYRTAPNTQAQSATWTNDTTTAPYAAIIAAFRAVGAVSVSGTAPANSVVPAITGTTTEEETLTASTGTWSGTVVSYTYQWKADGVNISGATASTYVLTASEVGADITVAVTATNEVGSTTATSAAVGPIIAAFTGILDGLSTSATGAFSAFRRLRVGYTGSLIRVQRSSDSTEQDIGYGVDNLLDQSALTTFVGAGDGRIVTWYDQSGNGRDVIQTVPSTDSPRIVISGSVVTTINSKPCLSFDGTNDYLQSNTALSNYYATTGLTAVAIMRAAAFGTSGTYPNVASLNPGLIGDLGGGPHIVMYTTAGNYYSMPYVYNGTTGKWIANQLAGNPDTAVVAMRYPSGANTLRGWANGGTGSSDATVGAAIAVGDGTNRLRIGRGYTAARFTGNIAEVVLFNVAISIADLNTLGGNMATQAGETWSTVT